MKTKTDLTILTKYKIKRISANEIGESLPAALTCDKQQIAILTASPVGSIQGSILYNDLNRRECSYVQDALKGVSGCLQVVLGHYRKRGEQYGSDKQDLELYISKP